MSYLGKKDKIISVSNPQKPVKSVEDLRNIVLNLDSGNEIIHQYRTLFIKEHPGRKHLIEHSQTIYTAICSIQDNNTSLNTYGRDLLKKYKNSCSESNVPWELFENPCLMTQNIETLGNQAEKYALCAFKRARFSSICVKHSDPSHPGAISKQYDQEAICNNKIASILTPAYPQTLSIQPQQQQRQYFPPSPSIQPQYTQTPSIQPPPQRQYLQLAPSIQPQQQQRQYIPYPQGPQIPYQPIPQRQYIQSIPQRQYIQPPQQTQYIPQTQYQPQQTQYPQRQYIQPLPQRQYSLQFPQRQYIQPLPQTQPPQQTQYIQPL